MATEQCPPQEELEFKLRGDKVLFDKKIAVPGDITSKWFRDNAYCTDSMAIRVCMDSPFGPDVVYVEDEDYFAGTSKGLLTGGIQKGTDVWKPLAIDSEGRLCVDAAISIQNVDLEVNLTHLDDFPEAGDVHDSIRIGDGTETVEVNPDGSINVVVVSSSGTPNLIRSIYTEVIGIATSIDTLLVTYTVPIGKTAELLFSEFSGENISEYRILLNGTVIDKKRTYFSSALNGIFDFRNTKGGLLLTVGDIVDIRTIHGRPHVGDFNARIQVLEIG